MATPRSKGERGDNVGQNTQNLESYNSPQTERDDTPSGDSKSARHSENSQRGNGRELPPFEAQKSLAVRRRTDG